MNPPRQNRPQRNNPRRPAEPDPIAPISEKQLARLWERRAALQEAFRSEAGVRVRVLYPGRPGVTAGPDFRDALLLVEGEGLVQGDVEVHLDQRDWNAHGHAGDPNYNGVVLHVALDTDGQPSRTVSGATPPLVNLASLLDQPPDNAAAAAAIRHQLWRVLGHHGYRRPETPDRMRALLNRAGDERFLSHSRRFQTLMCHQSPQQTLWESVCDALGYRHNRHPFLRLAVAAPFGALASAARRMPVAQRDATLTAWLHRIAGFESGPTPPGLGPPLDAGEWRLFRVRPPNHPRRRMMGAASLASRYCEGGLIAGMARAAASGNPSLLDRALTVPGVDGKAAPVGASRARDIAVNVVLPFLHGHSTLAGDPDRAGSIMALYRDYGPLSDNEITRELAAALHEPSWGRLADNARRQQGLIHLQRLLCGASPVG